MCGIAGLITDQKQEIAIVQAMLDTQVHRGPDGVGQWSSTDGRLALGHRRLAILDLSAAGAQPMTDATGRFVITYNGELYNYLEIKAELLKLGVSFQSHTDTEVIIQAYKQWGVDCLKKFNGMFAFALYDQVQQRLFCARDRYGEKPFLFSFGKDFFAFASEYKALLLHPRISLEIDEWRLLRFAHRAGTGLDGDRQTVFRDVCQLLPGEAMVVDVHSFDHRIWPYWQIQPGEPRQVGDERVVFEEFRDLLVDAVRLRMRSDVAVGSCLSGGLDSSSIVCIARQLLGDHTPYHTFTGRFPGTSADEWGYASQVVEATGVVSHVVEPTVEGFLEELPEFLWFNELPVGSSSQYAQWNVFRLAKQQGVTVLLDGQGSDETLGGYEQYFAVYLEALRLGGEQERLARELPLIQERYPAALLRGRAELSNRLPLWLRHGLSNHLGIGTSSLYGMDLDVARKLTMANSLPSLAGYNPLTNALVQDTFGRFLTTLLRYGDRNSMAHSREVRLPFCDHRIAEFVVSLPPSLLMGEVQTKRLLRESMVGLLPENIRTRWNKQGFLPPQNLWFKSEKMLAQVEDTFYSASFQQSPYWRAGWWQKALQRVRQGELSLGWALWSPFILEQWKQHFMTPIKQRR